MKQRASSSGPPVRSSNARRTALSAVTAVLTLAATATACVGSGRPSGSTRSNAQLVWGKPAEVVLLDPAGVGSASSWQILQLVYEGLTTLGAGLKPVPALAESWNQTSPTTYVFNLRKGVKFSNGRELTADDVKESLQRVMDPKEASSWAIQLGIKRVTAIDDHRVQVTLTTPRTSFLAALAGPEAAILPMRELKAGTYDPKKQLLGTGPFKVAAHSQNESWTFVRNPYYWRSGVPKVATLNVKIMVEDAARVAALRNGTIDVTTFEAPDSIRLLQRQQGVRTVVQPTTDFYRLDINAKTSMFQDERLRQAVALAVDRGQLGKVALGGMARPTAAVSVAFPGACDPSAVPFARTDLERAKSLVAAAGATGKPVEIISTPIIPMSAPIAQVLQRNLQAIGFKVHITSMDIGVALKRVYSKKPRFDLSVAWDAGYADPAMALPLWNPDVSPFASGYTKLDPELNKVIDSALTTAPGPDRAQPLRDACGRIAQDANTIPLVSKDAFIAYRSDKISANIPPVEGYAIPLRDIAEFGVK